ncbi:hypothetical protein VE02_00513 [Pseudogymnoascus sp. 03VT05]|nr:hypothetical protein VE02_00513 [Pseudogymnoascus sp. 03VT05]
MGPSAISRQRQRGGYESYGAGCVLQKKANESYGAGCVVQKANESYGAGCMVIKQLQKILDRNQQPVSTFASMAPLSTSQDARASISISLSLSTDGL